MNSYVRALLGWGSAGAAANAGRECERRKAEADALEARLQEIVGGLPSAASRPLISRPAAQARLDRTA